MDLTSNGRLLVNLRNAGRAVGDLKANKSEHPVPDNLNPNNLRAADGDVTESPLLVAELHAVVAVFNRNIGDQAAGAGLTCPFSSLHCSTKRLKGAF